MQDYVNDVSSYFVVFCAGASASVVLLRPDDLVRKTDVCVASPDMFSSSEENLGHSRPSAVNRDCVSLQVAQNQELKHRKPQSSRQSTTGDGTVMCLRCDRIPTYLPGFSQQMGTLQTRGRFTHMPPQTAGLHPESTNLESATTHRKPPQILHIRTSFWFLLPCRQRVEN